MSARDPETGRFVSGPSMDFSDIEVATFTATIGVQAADLGGNTGFVTTDRNDFEGLELLDYDEFVDRNEELVLLSADHHLSVFANSTETADGTVVAAVEISADPSVTRATSVAATPTATDAVGPDDVVGNAGSEDSIDLIGRVLHGMAGAPFSDGATGVGGGGSAGEDHVSMTVAPAEFGRFHPRDELFLNGRINAWNIDDAGIHAHVQGQHVYGVLAE